MANEIPPNKGEQVKGGPPTVDNTQLPPMAKQARPPKLMHGAVRQMTVGAVPVHGSNLIALVPQDHMPKPRAGGKPTSPLRQMAASSGRSGRGRSRFGRTAAHARSPP